MVTNSVRKLETIEFDENYKQKSYNKRKHVSKNHWIWKTNPVTKYILFVFY